MVDVDNLNQRIQALLRRVAAEELLPRLGTAESTAEQKSPGEVVTAADLAAEAAITGALHELTPQATIIGEEAAHANPLLLESIEEHAWAWLVDPLDGTRQFAAGTGPFGIMLALLRAGRCEAAWIYLPLSDELAHARRGEGCWINDERCHIPPAPPVDALRGGLLTRFFPAPLKARAESVTFVERTEGAHHCAAQRYVDTVCGREHFAAYWRTLPWDHAPGALLVQEAGGTVERFDGSPYLAADTSGTSLLVAADRATWHHVQSQVLGLPSAHE